MKDPSVSGRVGGNSPEQLTGELLRMLTGAPGLQTFLVAATRATLAACGGEIAGVARQRWGNWVTEVWVTPEGPGSGETALPELEIGEAIDGGRVYLSERWCVAPLVGAAPVNPEAEGEWGVPDGLVGDSAVELRELWGELQKRLATSSLFIRRGEPGGDDQAIAQRARAAANVMASGVRMLATAEWRSRRITELHRILKAAAEWQRMETDDQLLRAIADTACDLLRCERASIFLWDRRRGKLIGRPAIGFEEEPLEVDDGAGIVGEVLRGGEAKFWTAESGEEERVNREVDRQTDFRTRSLVAVPMWAPRPEPDAVSEAGSEKRRLIGVFEAINRVDETPTPSAFVDPDGFERGDAVMLADLATHAAVAIQLQQTRRRLTAARDRLLEDAARETPLVGRHRSIRAVRETASKVAATELTVLVLGENGTGKEVLARHIHFESPRRDGPFVAVNCAALVESLLESELFGHEQGAFTDARQAHAGKFEQADGGTLFLDEVGDMSPGGQAKLLRVLEEKVVVRVGGSRPIPVDVRVIAATNQSLEQMVVEKRFRQDLFFRLNVVSMTLPPLRERGDDIQHLADHFVAQFAARIGRGPLELSDRARQALAEHTWPGNVRELRNTIERGCYLSGDGVVTVDDLMLRETPPSSVTAGGLVSRTHAADSGTMLLAEATRQFQVSQIDRAIEACQGNMTDAAARLGLHRSNLYRKMRQLGMPTSAEEAER